MKKLILAVILSTAYLIGTDLNKPVTLTVGELAIVKTYVTNMEAINGELVMECNRLRAEFENARVVLEEEVKKQNRQRARYVGIGIAVGAGGEYDYRCSFDYYFAIFNP